MHADVGDYLGDDGGGSVLSTSRVMTSTFLVGWFVRARFLRVRFFFCREHER